MGKSEGAERIEKAKKTQSGQHKWAVKSSISMSKTESRILRTKLKFEFQSQVPHVLDLTLKTSMQNTTDLEMRKSKGN